MIMINEITKIHIILYNYTIIFSSTVYSGVVYTYIHPVPLKFRIYPTIQLVGTYLKKEKKKKTEAY